MYISEASYTALNHLLKSSFQMNSYADNIAYNLGYRKMINCEDIFHHKFAHAFPALADTISEVMLKLEARPLRLALDADTIEYDSYVAMFDDLKSAVDKYRQEIIEVIAISELNDDYEIKISLEEFLNNFLIYVNQVNLWVKKAHEYREDVQKFDHDFKSFTLL